MTVFSEDDLLPISALQHVMYCERQAALIHIERLWSENEHTIEGRHLHEAAHDGRSASRPTLHVARALALRNFEIGIAGLADVVEFRPSAEGIELPGRAGRWSVYPVEYKRGRPKRHRADEVQLCAQALCLEEMLRTSVLEGALFYGKTRRRRVVVFDETLRETTVRAATLFRRLVEARDTPVAQWSSKCRQCSLLSACWPRAGEKSARRYLSSHIAYAAEAP